MARKLDGNYITANTITTTQLQTTVVTQIQAGGGPKVTTITYPNSATAAVNTGNESIVLTGTGFESGVQVYINGAAAPAVSRTNSTSLSFTTPALSTGTTYPLYVVNPDGGTAVVVPGMVVSAGPVWVTGSALSGWNKDSALSTTLQATSDSTVSYALDVGSSLPSGITLAANGLLSGTLTSPPGAQTTYNFTVTATDLELQKSSKAFSINATMGITATGGTVSNIAGYRVHTFTSSGSFQVTSGSGDIEYLVVAGGGKGGHAGWGGGGGGAGGLLTGNVSVSPGTYTVTVGGGGSGSTNMYTTTSDPGSNSSIVGSSVSVIGIGGGGGSGAGGGAYGYGFPGGNGGSGGGAAQRNAPIAGGKGVYPGSSYISAARQGYDGGWVLGGGDSGGGGGGAGGAGANTSGSGGNGGIGLQSNISGTAIYYAGGGAGGGGSAVGGNGGGGNTATSGTANRGGGGGGNNFDNTVGNGGSGIVIIRYAA
jgi:hypothetical protein